MNNIRWEDLVFANRNQAYGAYPLRKAYASRVTIAFAFAMTVTAMMIAYPVIRKLFDTEGMVVKEVKKDDYNVLENVPVIETIHLPPPPSVPVKQIKFIPPRVTQEEVADVTPTMQELQTATVSATDIQGADIIFDDPVEIEPVNTAEDVDKVWITVEQRPEFPGGFAEMMKFISKNIKYPASARRMSIEGKVFISFVVNADGTIDNIETIKGVYGDCDKEAMRVIAKMPTWKPGRQNGKAVKVKFVVPINFTLSGV